MKKYMTQFVAAATIILSTIGITTTTSAVYVNQADIDIAEAVVKSVTDFSDEIGSQSASSESVQLAAERSQAILDRYIQHRYSTNLGEAYIRNADEAQKIAETIKVDIAAISDALAAEDIQAANDVFGDYNIHIQDFNTALQQIDTSVVQSNTKNGTKYLVLVVASALLTALSFAWAFKEKHTDPSMSKARKAIAYASLAPLAGAAITYGTYVYADKLGGSYFIAWGPIVIGVIFYVKAIAAYNSLKKSPPKLPPNPAV